MRLARTVGVLTLLCACGPDDAVEAELDELCGEVGSVRVLELDDDEAFAGRAVRIDDRVYFVIGDAVEQADAPFDENPFGADTPMPTHPRAVSTGPCGEEPRQIADGVDFVYVDERWPGAVLGRDDDTYDTMVLDPLGIAPPRVLVPELPRIELAPGVHTNSRSTDFGLVAVVPEGPDALVGTLTLQPYPATIDDPAPPTVELLADITVEYSGFTAREDRVFALTGAGVVVELDLMDGSVEDVVEGASSFHVSEDASFVAYQMSAGGEGPWPTFLLVRETGETISLGDSGLPFLDGAFRDELTVELVPESGFSSRLIEIPSLEIHDIPADINLWFRSPEGRHFAMSNGEFILYDVETDERQLLFADYGPFSTFPDGMHVLDIESLGAPDYFRRTGTLWRAPYDGSPIERIARRASPSHRYLADDRVVTPVEIDDAYLGDLVVVDPDSLEEQLVDTRVLANSIVPSYDEGPFDSGVIAYTVRDGDRSGVWIAKPTGN